MYIPNNPEFITVENDFDHFRIPENSANQQPIYPWNASLGEAQITAGIFNFHQGRGRELSHQGDGGCFKF